MKMTQGVEWAAHACALLAGAPAGYGLSRAALAAFHELPPAYMAKHLQSLSRAGLLRSSRGAQGGYQLARPPKMISLWDVETAILGPQPRFECQNIRTRGPCAAQDPAGPPCEIACAFWEAERAYRSVLQATSIADIARSVAARQQTLGHDGVQVWLAANLVRIDRETAPAMA